MAEIERINQREDENARHVIDDMMREEFKFWIYRFRFFAAKCILVFYIKSKMTVAIRKRTKTVARRGES